MNKALHREEIRLVMMALLSRVGSANVQNQRCCCCGVTAVLWVGLSEPRAGISKLLSQDPLEEISHAPTPLSSSQIHPPILCPWATPSMDSQHL